MIEFVFSMPEWLFYGLLGLILGFGLAYMIGVIR